MYTLTLTEDEIYELLESLGDRKTDALASAEKWKKWGFNDETSKIVIAHCDTLTSKLNALLEKN